MEITLIYWQTFHENADKYFDVSFTANLCPFSKKWRTKPWTSAWIPLEFHWNVNWACIEHVHFIGHDNCIIPGKWWHAAIVEQETVQCSKKTGASFPNTFGIADSYLHLKILLWVCGTFVLSSQIQLQN